MNWQKDENVIRSFGNSKLKELRELMEKSKSREEAKAYVAEGLRLYREIPKDLLLQTYLRADIFALHKEELPKENVFLVDPEVFQRISDTKNSQGILGVVSMKPQENAEKQKKLLVLDGVSDPGNLGTMIRCGEGAGMDGIVASLGTADFYNPKTVRASMGSSFRMALTKVPDLKEWMTLEKKQGRKFYGALLDGSVPYTKPNYQGEIGIVIGNEANGISGEIAALCDYPVRIPMEGKVESLNAAVAAALLMYECHNKTT